MNVADLWHSTDPQVWDSALHRYWQFVKPENVDLEHALNELDLERLRAVDASGWYKFLHDEYFKWKYTAPNRYATTTASLRRYLEDRQLAELDTILRKLLKVDTQDVRRALSTAKDIHGLGTAGASGLLAIMYPEKFGTVDQFVVKALQSINDLPEANILAKIRPQDLSISDGVVLIDILRRKARQNNECFGVSTWTPRKIDMVLWTCGR